MSNTLKKVFGIDLGTTYSCIAYVDEYGKPVVIPNLDNDRITPSVVFFDEGNNIVVGNTAKENSVLHPNEVIAFAKRDMGNEHFAFEHNGTRYRPEEISSFILKKLVNDAKEILGEEVVDVVITCPAYFGINEREATRLAGEIAGLHVRQIINEPTAAAISYGMAETSESKVVLVYDLGGGTFDITMIKISPEEIKVVCTGGDHYLGGKNWDDAIVAYLVEEFQRETGVAEDILLDPETCQDLIISAEKAKKTLSQREKAPVSITYGGERVKVELTREKFEELTQSLLEKTVSLTQEMLGEARKKGHNQFDEILLVGGSCRMPQIATRIEREFNVTPKLFDPDESVAKGAAIFGWKLTINDELIKRIEKTSGKKVADIAEVSKEVIDRAAEEISQLTGFTLPAVKSSLKRITNVVSKSFGMVAFDRAYLPQEVEKIFNLIVKNTPVPAKVTQMFGTHSADQRSVRFRIMENEVSDQKIDPTFGNLIGEAVMELPAGLPENSPLEITFALNEEGRLHMTAIEMTQKRQVEATIQTTSVIQKEELEEAKNRSKVLNVS